MLVSAPPPAFVLLSHVLVNVCPTHFIAALSFKSALCPLIYSLVFKLRSFMFFLIPNITRKHHAASSFLQTYPYLLDPELPSTVLIDVLISSFGSFEVLNKGLSI